MCEWRRILAAIAATLLAGAMTSGRAAAQCPVDDAFEENDDCSSSVQAVPGLTTGLLMWGSLHPGGADPDFYHLQLPSEREVVVDVFLDASSGPLGLAILSGESGCPGPIVGTVTGVGTNHVQGRYTNPWAFMIGITVFVSPDADFDCNSYDIDVRVVEPMAGDPFCFGDGSDGVVCPCGNWAATGSAEGCLNATGSGGKLEAYGYPLLHADLLELRISSANPDEFGVFASNVSIASPVGQLFNGYLCLDADVNLNRYAGGIANPILLDGRGSGVNDFSLAAADNENLPATTVAGATVHYQFWHRDDPAGGLGPCGAGANFTAGVSVTWMP